MNRYQFHQAVHIAGTDFRRGVHEVSEKVEYDSTFIRYVGLGLITEADAKTDPPSPQSIAERNKALHDRLVKRTDDRKATSHAAKSPPASAPEGKAKSEEDDADFFEGEKSHKKEPHHADKKKK